MFSNYPRGRNVPHDLDRVNSSHPLDFDEARRAAWLLGGPDVRQSIGPPVGRKLRRSQLPDVDFSTAVPDPSYVPPLARLADALRLLAGWLDRLSGSRRGSLGESASASYMSDAKSFSSGRIHSRAV